MRTFLRADPDVIMIGEMRDEETARVAVEASVQTKAVPSSLRAATASTATRMGACARGAGTAAMAVTLPAPVVHRGVLEPGRAVATSGLTHSSLESTDPPLS